MRAIFKPGMSLKLMLGVATIGLSGCSWFSGSHHHGGDQYGYGGAHDSAQFGNARYGFGQSSGSHDWQGGQNAYTSHDAYQTSYNYPALRTRYGNPGYGGSTGVKRSRYGYDYDGKGGCPAGTAPCGYQEQPMVYYYQQVIEPPVQQVTPPAPVTPVYEPPKISTPIECPSGSYPSSDGETCIMKETPVYEPPVTVYEPPVVSYPKPSLPPVDYTPIRK